MPGRTPSDGKCVAWWSACCVSRVAGVVWDELVVA